MTPTEFINTLMPIANRYGFSVTSWYRTEKRNKRFKGKANSRHRLWLAIDGALDNPADKEDFIDECNRQGLVAIKSNDGAIHVQTK